MEADLLLIQWMNEAEVERWVAVAVFALVAWIVWS
jgi:hypothetical protein